MSRLTEDGESKRERFRVFSVDTFKKREKHKAKAKQKK
jgi:hypothetical protein